MSDFKHEQRRRARMLAVARNQERKRKDAARCIDTWIERGRWIAAGHDPIDFKTTIPEAN